MKNKILTIVFILLITASAVMIWLPADTQSVAKENRSIAKMPDTDIKSILSGEFSSGFEDYIGDNVGFRGAITNFASAITSHKGITSRLGKIVSVNKDVGTETTKKSRLLVSNDKIMEVFEKDPESMESYLDLLKYYSENLDKDIDFYCMLIPTQLEFQDKIYSNIQDSQRQTIDYIYKNMPSRISPVNAYDWIKDHIDEYLYYRTDHHWTARGAYYGYRAFTDALRDNAAEDKKDEFKPVWMEDYPLGKIDNFIGSLYNQAQSPEMKQHADTIEWFDVNELGYIDISDEYYENGNGIKYDSVIFAKDKTDYSFFLGGDQPLVELTNSSKPDGRTAIIIKDSYSNSFAPWIIQNYHKVVLIDPRTYTGGMQELLNRYSPDDVLIMNYIFTTTFKDYCQLAIDFYNR